MSVDTDTCTHTIHTYVHIHSMLHSTNQIDAHTITCTTKLQPQASLHSTKKAGVKLAVFSRDKCVYIAALPNDTTALTGV